MDGLTEMPDSDKTLRTKLSHAAEPLRQGWTGLNHGRALFNCQLTLKQENAQLHLRAG